MEEKQEWPYICMVKVLPFSITSLIYELWLMIKMNLVRNFCLASTVSEIIRLMVDLYLTMAETNVQNS